jgi:hypothetical protein
MKVYNVTVLEEIRALGEQTPDSARTKTFSTKEKAHKFILKDISELCLKNEFEVYGAKSELTNLFAKSFIVVTEEEALEDIEDKKQDEKDLGVIVHILDDSTVEVHHKWYETPYGYGLDYYEYEVSETEVD